MNTNRYLENATVVVSIPANHKKGGGSCFNLQILGNVLRDALGKQVEVDLDDERAQLEAELARIDAEWGHRDTTPTATSSPPDAALADLESRLSNIDF